MKLKKKNNWGKHHQTLALLKMSIKLVNLWPEWPQRKNGNDTNQQYKLWRRGMTTDPTDIKQQKNSMSNLTSISIQLWWNEPIS